MAGGAGSAGSALTHAGPTEDEREARGVVARAMRAVATELGNTPAVARDAYVSPVVVDAYLAGRTLEDFRAGRRRPARLSDDERALLRLRRASARRR